MSTRVLTAHIPEELAEKVDRYAKSMERSRAWIVKRALTDWVDWEEDKDRRTREALESADRVGTIPHEEVAAWAKSLSTDNPLPRPKPRKA
ncbi:MAG: CopG family ribbon-helix-helix protein [Devosia sp.]